METLIDDPPVPVHRIPKLSRSEADTKDLHQHRRRRERTEISNTSNKDELIASENRRRRRKDKKSTNTTEDSPTPRQQQHQRKRDKAEETLIDDVGLSSKPKPTANERVDRPQELPRKRSEKTIETVIDDPPSQHQSQTATQTKTGIDPPKNKNQERPVTSSRHRKKQDKEESSVKRQSPTAERALLKTPPREADESSLVTSSSRKDSALKTPSAVEEEDTLKTPSTLAEKEDTQKPVEENTVKTRSSTDDSLHKTSVSSAPQKPQEEIPDRSSGTQGFAEDDLNPENHQLSDFKDLCKSVASLLHIEDQAAAAMLTEPLSGRRDLVEGLDAEAIFDYLTQHGVLDSQTLQALRNSSGVTQRNAALLQHVEREGHNAVALFINALRQSGQLHLASSLDNTRRIQPVSEGDYFEKQRHKGELTIIIKVHALLIVVPERDSEGDVIDGAMLASSNKGLHGSYDNMRILKDEPAIVDCSDDEEDTPKKKSFLCSCFPSRAGKKQKAKEKKYVEQYEMKTRNSGSGGGGKGGGKESDQKDRNGSRSGKSSTVSSLQHTGSVDLPEISFSNDSRRNSGSPRKELSVDQTDHKNGHLDRKGGKGDGQDKENADPVIMEYNKQMELVRLKAQRQGERSRNVSQSSAIVMCEKWKSGGQYFRKKLTALCEQFEFDLQTYIIKYIEQDRGTLVMSVWTDHDAMFVSNICMTRDQVRQLHKDHTSGALRERLDALLRTNQCLQKLDIKDMDLRIIIEEGQFQQAMRELA